MKALRIFLFVLIVVGVILLSTQKFWVPKLIGQILSSESTYKANPDQATESQKVANTSSPISITDKKIKEENFSGTAPVISGTSLLATKMREYVEKAVAEFRDEANADVPPMREKFGADNPTANYEIDINAKYIKSEKTESIAIEVYSYTGGAHGGTMYKALTASLPSGQIPPRILSLSDIIKQTEQDAFTEFIKKKLNDWRPEGSDASPLFADQVKDLKFADFVNWSLSDQSLTIYFDQYAIGPGALGAVAFPFSLPQVKNFLQL